MACLKINNILAVQDYYKNVMIINPYRYKSGGEIPRNGLIAEWLYADGANLADTSDEGNNHTLTNVGATFGTDRNGILNSSAQVGTGTGYLTAADNIDFQFGVNDSFSVFGIVNNTSNGSSVIYSKRGSQECSFRIIAGGFLTITFVSGVVLVLTSTNSIGLSSYGVVGLIVDRINDKCYLVTNTNKEEFDITGVLGLEALANNVQIGRRRTTLGAAHKQDTLRVYNRVITDEEIIAFNAEL